MTVFEIISVVVCALFSVSLIHCITELFVEREWPKTTRNLCECCDQAFETENEQRNVCYDCDMFKK